MECISCRSRFSSARRDTDAVKGRRGTSVCTDTETPSDRVKHLVPLLSFYLFFMDEIYRAKLSSTPHPPGALAGHGESSNMATSNVNQPFNPNPGAGMHQRPDDIHIQPHPHPHGMGMGADGHAQPIPIQLPNIYVNPFPAQDHTRDRDTTPGTRHVHREGEPINVPTSSTTHGHSRRSGSGTIKIGSWRFTKPHPLLWVCLGLSILALVLEVPKGSLPTLTGRHRALRVS